MGSCSTTVCLHHNCRPHSSTNHNGTGGCHHNCCHWHQWTDNDCNHGADNDCNHGADNNCGCNNDHGRDDHNHGRNDNNGSYNSHHGSDNHSVNGTNSGSHNSRTNSGSNHNGSSYDNRLSTLWRLLCQWGKDVFLPRSRCASHARNGHWCSKPVDLMGLNLTIHLLFSSVVKG